MLSYRFLLLAVLTLLNACSQENTSSSGAGTASAPANQANGVAIYPHSPEFKTSPLHGKFFRDNRVLCAKCHGDDYKGGAIQVSCFRCHSAYPHPADWALPTQHGDLFAQLGEADRQQCQGCHSAARKETGAATCKTCHVAYPHSEDFKGGGDDHPRLAGSWQGKCTVCHADMTRFLPNMGSCRTCHQGSPEMHWVAPPTTETATDTSTSTATDARVSVGKVRTPTSAHAPLKRRH